MARLLKVKMQSCSLIDLGQVPGGSLASKFQWFPENLHVGHASPSRLPRSACLASGHAYASSDVEPLHNWLGYAVTPIVVSRVLWAATGVPQLGLMRFYPKFESLRLGTAITHPAISRTLVLGISVCLVGATATGIAMDRGGALGVASVPAAVTITDNSMKQATRLAKVEVLYPAALLIGHYITLTICTTKSSANRLSEE